MAKKKITKAKSEQNLGKETIEEIEHFFRCFPPKYFSRNLRNMTIDLIAAHEGTEPLYIHELLMQLSMFLPVLDKIEDDGTFDSKDYERNREYY